METINYLIKVIKLSYKLIIIEKLVK